MFCAILTLFPEAVKPYLDESILRIAQASGQLSLQMVDFRRFASGRRLQVDDRPFGGGPGMVLKPEPIFAAVEDTERRFGACHKILMCPSGQTLTQRKVRQLAGMDRLLILCGRYEGFDERVRLGFDWDEISIGEYVLAGGELPAMVVLEAVARVIPGVLGCAESPEVESHEGQGLDHPQFTRPREFRGMTVPEVLLTGDHRAVARWRRQQSEHLTARRNTTDRPQEGPEDARQLGT
jgi:tRNA (guanine37-N1)-methyltransferase